ncbi:MAG: hypothetical protein FJ271_21885 [Planctomycetes bacterium]|nr:hypothetical protein [Planctomycetota bacterium]
MSGRASILGMLLVALAGCVTDRQALVGMKPAPLSADLEPGDMPRVSRAQRAEPGSEPVTLGRPTPPPLQRVSHQESAPKHDPLEGGRQVKVRAWVNGKPIFDEEIYFAVLPALFKLQELPEAERAKKHAEVYNAVLDQFIDRELLYQDAITKLMAVKSKALKEIKKIAKAEFEKEVRKTRERNKLTEEVFQKMLRAQGMTMESWERMEEKKFIANEYVASRVMPLIKPGIGHVALEEYYKTHRNQFQRVDSVKWQDIFIAVGPKHPTLADAHRRAEYLANRLRQGEPIANLLPENDGPNPDGEGLGQRRGEIRPVELERYLFEMHDNEVGPVVDISTGCHVIRVVRREYAGQIPFNEETQRIIANKLRGEIFERELKRILHDLRSRAVIEIERN